MGEKKTKLMLYSTLVRIEVEVGVELDNYIYLDFDNQSLLMDIYEKSKDISHIGKNVWP